MERSVNEKIMRLNILPNQFYAALAYIFGTETWRGMGAATASSRLPAPPPLENRQVAVLK